MRGIMRAAMSRNEIPLSIHQNGVLDWLNVGTNLVSVNTGALFSGSSERSSILGRLTLTGGSCSIPGVVT
jgi:hypothetical protein